MTQNLLATRRALMRAGLHCGAGLGLSGALPWVAPWAAAAQLGGRWRVTAGNTRGWLDLQQVANGDLQGTMLGLAVTGSVDLVRRSVVLLRGSPAWPDQVFEGRLSEDEQAISGRWHPLRPQLMPLARDASGLSWAALRGSVGPAAIPPPLALPSTPGPKHISGLHTLIDDRLVGVRGSTLDVHITHYSDNVVSGLRVPYPLHSFAGLYVREAASLAWYVLQAGWPVDVQIIRFGDGEPRRAEGQAWAPGAPGRSSDGTSPRTFAAEMRPASAITDRFGVNGNGSLGTLSFEQGRDGTIAGTLYDEPVQGFSADGEGMMVLLRGPLHRPHQAWVGRFSPDRRRWSGLLYGLDTRIAGHGPGQNTFAFDARRAPDAVPSVLVPPVLMQGTAPKMSELATVFNRPQEFGANQSGTLQVLRSDSEGNLEGLIFGDPWYGHFAGAHGTLALVRMRGGRPQQFFFGQAQPGVLLPRGFVPRFVGSFYALTPEAGATPQRMVFDWSANAFGCGNVCPPY